MQGLALGAASLVTGCRRNTPASLCVDDVSQLDPVCVDRMVRPKTTDAIRRAIVDGTGPVSIGGSRFSMGDQIVAAGSLHIDMRAMNRVLRLDPMARTVRVQAGATWRDVQELIDPFDLSVKVMQSYSNFTIGGSIAVNCHGRYVGAGPVIGTIRALQLVTADGRVLELQRERDTPLFNAVIGGYGGLGVVTEVELDLVGNGRIERQVQRVSLEDYPAWFRGQVLASPDAILHNANLAPPDFAAPLAITWRRTRAPLTEPQRLIPRDVDYQRDRALIWFASELPAGHLVRDRFLTERLLREPAVVWRNHQASLDARSLEPASRRFSTYLLQEYFVPPAAFTSFIATLQRILLTHEVNALNVSIRHSPMDRQSLLRWAATDVFSLVLYYKQASHASADVEAGRWTRLLVDAVLDHGGCHYLPYRLHATRSQFERAYPRFAEFVALKREIDPEWRFRNRMWDKYLQPA